MRQAFLHRSDRGVIPPAVFPLLLPGGSCQMAILFKGPMDKRPHVKRPQIQRPHGDRPHFKTPLILKAPYIFSFQMTINNF